MTPADDTMPPTRAALRDARAAEQRSAEQQSVEPEPARPRRKRKIVAWVVVSILIVIVASLALLGYRLYERAMAIQAELTDAQTLLPKVTQSVASFDFDAASATLDEASAHTQKAVALTDGWLWSAAEAVPVLGKNAVAVTELASITDDALTAARPVIAIGPSLTPSALAPVDGAIPIQPLLDAQPIVHVARTEVDALASRIDAVDVEGTVDVIASAKSTLATAVAKVQSPLESADSALSVAPKLLGAEGPQDVVVAFLNNAELRALGGTALSFAEISVEAGRISLVQAVPAGWGNFDITPSIVPVPEGFAEFAPHEYGEFITNAGARPSIGDAAAVISANWQKEFDRTPDIVMTMDVVALSYIVAATGPVDTGTGWVVDSGNLVDVLLNQALNAYAKYTPVEANAREDLVYAALVDQTFARVSSGQFDMSTMLTAITHAVGERRLLAWAADADVSAVLDGAGMPAGIPDSTEDHDLVGFYLSDNVGSKLNYYLDAATTVEGLCDADDTRRATLTLTSTLDPAAVDDLSASVLGQWKREDVDRGVQRMNIYIYGPTNGRITAAGMNGEAVDVTPFADDGHAVQHFRIWLEPGQTITLSVDIVTDSPAGTPLEMAVTPTVRALTSADVKTCGS